MNYCLTLTEAKWRLKPESNRRERLCRPLHNHSAIQPYCLKVDIVYESPVWSVIINAKNKRKLDKNKIKELLRTSPNKYEENVINWMSVLVLASKVTFVAPELFCLALKSLKAPTQNSLTSISPPTIPINILDNSRLKARIKNVTNILSAIGSSTAPIIDSSLYFLARKPSQ